MCIKTPFEQHCKALETEFSTKYVLLIGVVAFFIVAMKRRLSTVICANKIYGRTTLAD
jgi:hypothetical protein